MAKAPELAKDISAPQEIIDAALDGALVLFVGAGASRLLGLPSWGGLAERAFEDLRIAGCLDFSEVEQLRTLDAKRQLSIAELLAEEKGHKLDYKKYLGVQSIPSDIYDSLNAIGCPCVTTNYDTLLGPRRVGPKDGVSTSPVATRFYKREQFFPRLLNEPGTVVHLHGMIEERESMIVTTREYLSHYDNPNVQEFLKQLFDKKVVLFVGYGLDEAEVLEHILRRASVRSDDEPKHQRRRFFLQGYFQSQAPLYQNLHRYYESSFGVHVLGYLRDREDYKCQEKILRSWVGPT